MVLVRVGIVESLGVRAPWMLDPSELWTQPMEQCAALRKRGVGGGTGLVDAVGGLVWGLA